MHFFSVSIYNLYFFLLLFCMTYRSVALKVEILRSAGCLFFFVIELLSFEVESGDEISW